MDANPWKQPALSDLTYASLEKIRFSKISKNVWFSIFFCKTTIVYVYI